MAVVKSQKQKQKCSKKLLLFLNVVDFWFVIL